jgi:hypothetical protein
MCFMVSQNTQQPAASLQAGMQAYFETLDMWRKNYESMLSGMTGNSPAAPPPAAEAARAASDSAGLWRQPLEAFMQQVAQQQMELCRFWNQRLEQYAGFPSHAGQCKTLAELGQMQMNFFNKMMTDYAEEMRRFGNPVAEFMTREMPQPGNTGGGEKTKSVH